MAQKRNSRSNKSSRAKKQPELRTGGGRAAKAKRSEQREAAATRSSDHGPSVRIRPAGAGGYLLLFVLSWLGAAAVVFAGLLLDRWNLVSYPDSLWLYTAFGAAAVAPVVGMYARSQGDVNAWAAQTLLVPLGMFAAERVLGPECPPGGNCAVVGARGSFGMLWSIVFIVGVAALAWGLAWFFYSRARKNRPASGRVRAGRVIVGMIIFNLLLGAPLAAAFVGSDLLIRDTPSVVADARTDVANNCFDDLGADPALSVRPAPEGQLAAWNTFAVRRTDEDRPGVPKAAPKPKKGEKAAKPEPTKLPDNWATLDYVHPYEAVASYSDGELIALNCRKIDPKSGNATAEDLQENEPTNNPLDPATTGSQFRPLFYTQGPVKPSPEAEAADAKKQNAAAVAKAKATPKADTKK